MQKSNAFPTSFRAHVFESQWSREGYAQAGYYLARIARNEVESDVDDDTLKQLDKALDEGPSAVVQWLSTVLPRCMAIVPRRRLPTFTAGVARAMEEDDV